jgi:hypothetical protein
VQTLQAAFDKALAQAFDRRASNIQGDDDFFVRATVIGFEQNAGAGELARPVLTAPQQFFQQLAFNSI